MQRRFSHRMMNGRRAFLAARKRSVPLRSLIPNMVTLVGLCVGLTSIRMAIEGRFETALGAIALAAVLDGIDGRMARLLKASSRFGAELDSLSDFVCFGVAPSVLLYLWGFGDVKSLGWIVVLVFSIAAALRLARFNVALDEPSKPIWQSAFFVGVPVPAGAILVLLPLYLEGLGVPKAWMPMPVIGVYAICIGALMVSRIRTFSGKLIGRRIAPDYIAPVVALAVVLVATLVTYPYLSVTAGCLTYLALIPVSMRRYAELEHDYAAIEAPALAHDAEAAAPREKQL
ncbi:MULTISPECIES: CDP-diacylglycerol--serine O-phosphatidyltransferase [Rhodomicrobium]|uniref:CDP-diacylglycerol--serine O-phosphatidyltransferase n=1 Tax=Rhodomicrobium TaxID=1068 RepID=UPI000B4A8413|nr:MULTISPECIES: CDP-diacylglycerol--serine O-phosphatidyltransferase [Rhodomicrobium]